MSPGSPLDNQLGKLDFQQYRVNQGQPPPFKQRMEAESRSEMTMTMIDSYISSSYFKAIFIINFLNTYSNK